MSRYLDGRTEFLKLPRLELLENALHKLFKDVEEGERAFFVFYLR
jgi:hypothetical protein